MDIIKTYLIQSPLILASFALVVAAMFLSEKEKGAPLILAGALGLCVMTLLAPIIYSVIVPKLIIDMEVEDIGNIYMVLNLITNIIWGGSIGLIAYGTFMRVSPPQQP